MITDQEFQAIIDDDSKWIEGDISWFEDEYHSHAREFRVAVHSGSGEPLQINGRYNAYSGKLSFALLRHGTGRIYGLDLGVSHGRQNPVGMYAKHKHRWSEARKDKDIYEPSDITAPVDRPVEVWDQFCAEAGIDHQGTLHDPPVRLDLPI